MGKKNPPPWFPTGPWSCKYPRSRPESAGGSGSTGQAHSAWASPLPHPWQNGVREYGLHAPGAWVHVSLLHPWFLEGTVASALTILRAVGLGCRGHLVRNTKFCPPWLVLTTAGETQGPTGLAGGMTVKSQGSPSQTLGPHEGFAASQLWGLGRVKNSECSINVSSYSSSNPVFIGG